MQSGLLMHVTHPQKGAHCSVFDLQGTVIMKKSEAQTIKQRADGTPVMRMVTAPVLSHVDIIADTFWEAHADILH